MEPHKMKIIEKEFNIQTGEETITERDETAAEKKERETREKEIATAQAQAEAKATARQAIADRLGLTADELQVLLG
jgi:inosine/xanthosine triphosphate pyrophosphatase family protein